MAGVLLTARGGARLLQMQEPLSRTSVLSPFDALAPSVGSALECWAWTASRRTRMSNGILLVDADPGC